MRVNPFQAGKREEGARLECCQQNQAHARQRLMRSWFLGLLVGVVGAFLSCTPTPTLTPSPTALPSATATLSPQTQEEAPATSPTRTATETSTVLPTPTPTPGQQGPTLLSVPPDLDRYALAQRLGQASSGSTPGAAYPDPPEYTVGQRDSFQLLDLALPALYTIEAELKLITPHAYWYLQRGADVSLDRLEAAAMVFEQEIRPTVLGLFGPQWEPGVNGDPRLTILHARLRGASGYYSAGDEYPTGVSPGSNERRLIYLDAKTLEVASPGYYGVLAHEFQHVVHWIRDPGEEAWVNEGLSEVAAFLTGHPSGLVSSYRANPQTQLNAWAMPMENSRPHYGASYLFFLYLAAHYGGYQDLKQLVAQPSGGIEGVNAYLANLGYEETFRDVFRDWVVANYLPQGEGQHAYPIESVQIPPTSTLRDYGRVQDTIPQFSAQYVELQLQGTAARITFQGAPTVALLPIDPPSGSSCWWSNLGDSIDSRLFRRVDLSEVEEATLTFRAWYDIEEDWDHAYMIVSRDSGKTWDILEGLSTITRNPVGVSYGPALTGRSNGWVEEEVDLSAYAGERVLVGFEYVTDEVTNGDGLCLDDIAIPEVAYFDDAETPGNWQAEGFVRVGNPLPQEFIVQVVGLQDDQVVFVEEVALDGENRGATLVEGFGDTLDSVVVVIAPVTAVTRQPASYTLTVSEP